MLISFKRRHWYECEEMEIIHWRWWRFGCTDLGSVSFPEQMADGGLSREHAPHSWMWVLTEGEWCVGVRELLSEQRPEPKRRIINHTRKGETKSNTRKATPSFNSGRLQLTVIFYHFAGGKVFITTLQLYMLVFFTAVGRVSAGGRVEGAL